MLFHHRQRDDVHMIVVNGITVLFGQRFVQLVCMHDRRQHFFFSVFLHRKPIGFFIELNRILIPAVIFKVLGINIHDHLIKDFGVWTQATQRDLLIVDHLLQLLVVCQITAILEMDIHRGTGQIHIHIGVAFIFPFVVSFCLADGCSRICFDTRNTIVCFFDIHHLLSYT